MMDGRWIQISERRTAEGGLVIDPPGQLHAVQVLLEQRVILLGGLLDHVFLGDLAGVLGVLHRHDRP